jgi:hypothetical protein
VIQLAGEFKMYSTSKCMLSAARLGRGGMLLQTHRSGAPYGAA